MTFDQELKYELCFIWFFVAIGIVISLCLLWFAFTIYYKTFTLGYDMYGTDPTPYYVLSTAIVMLIGVFGSIASMVKWSWKQEGIQ